MRKGDMYHQQLLISVLIASYGVQCMGFYTHYTVSALPGPGLFYKHLQDTLYAVSALDCAVMCGRLHGCFGYKFQKRENRCETRSFINSEEKSREASLFLSYASTDVCGFAPDVRHARKTVTTGYYIGAVTEYTCHHDYTSCRQATTSSCQANGQWQKVSDLCQRCTWRNPKPSVRHRIPCGNVSEFAVTIIATPTRRTRFDILVQAGDDVLLIMAFILQSRKVSDTFGVNSRIRGEYMKGYSVPLKLKVGKKVKIHISYTDRNFTIQINQSHKTTYQNTGKKHPESVMLLLDAMVRLVHFAA